MREKGRIETVRRSSSSPDLISGSNSLADQRSSESAVITQSRDQRRIGSAIWLCLSAAARRSLAPCRTASSLLSTVRSERHQARKGALLPRRAFKRTGLGSAPYNRRSDAPGVARYGCRSATSSLARHDGWIPDGRERGTHYRQRGSIRRPVQLIVPWQGKAVGAKGAPSRTQSNRSA